MGKRGEELLRVRRLEQDRNIPGLIQLLEAGTKDGRLEAVWALGRLGDDRAIPYLMERTDDSDRLIRLCACQALGVLRAKAAKELLLQLLQDSDDWVRAASAGALCRVGYPDTNPGIRAALRAALERESDREVSLAIAESLMVLNDRDVRHQVPELIRALPWLRRRDQNIKRLKRAVELGQPLTPKTYLWEPLGPKAS